MIYRRCTPLVFFDRFGSHLMSINEPLPELTNSGIHAVQAVLGLGNIGSEAALQVMEGKAILFKSFAGIDGVPIVVNSHDARDIINTAKAIAPTFGGVNLEDIAAPTCFVVEDGLQDIGIPVFHDDQHGTAIVLLAALQNASKVIGKPLTEMRVVVNGAGAAGIAIAGLLWCVGWQPARAGRYCLDGSRSHHLGDGKPTPEIMPDVAKRAGAVNEVSTDRILPVPLDKEVATTVAEAVARAAVDDGRIESRGDPR